LAEKSIGGFVSPKARVKENFYQKYEILYLRKKIN